MAVSLDWAVDPAGSGSWSNTRDKISTRSDSFIAYFQVADGWIFSKFHARYTYSDGDVYEYDYDPSKDYVYVDAPSIIAAGIVSITYTGISTAEPVYTATFNKNGGEGTDKPSQQARAGRSITLPVQGNWTRDGYTFDGWCLDAYGSGEVYSPGASYKMTSNTVFYAKWTRISYTATFSKNGGEGTDLTPVTGYVISLPSAPDWHRSEYYFSGWCLNADGTGTVHSPGSLYTLSANTVFYAKWTRSEDVRTTLSFSKNGGSGQDIPSVTNYVGTAYTLPTPSWMIGSVSFYGWNTRADGTGMTYSGGGIFVFGQENTVLYAVYATSAMQARYVHGTGIANYSAFGHTYSGGTFAQNSISFEGYTENADVPVSDLKFNRQNKTIVARSSGSSANYYLPYYGTWTGCVGINGFKLKYTDPPQTGTILPSDATLRYYYASYRFPSGTVQSGVWNIYSDTFQYYSQPSLYGGLEIELPNSSWSKGTGVIGTIGTCWLSILTLQYEGLRSWTGKPDFSVSAVDTLGCHHDASISDRGELYNYSFYGNRCVVTAPTIQRYEFVGWFLDGSLVSGSASYTLPTTTSSSRSRSMLVARYASVESIVYFNPCGGVLDPTKYSKRVDYESQYGELPTATRTGYTFLGWFTAAEGGTQVTASTVVSVFGDHFLFAHWSGGGVSDDITVQFNFNGGSGSPSAKIVTAGSAYGTLPSPTYGTRAFGGWWSSVVGGVRVQPTTIVLFDYDHTLIARWAEEMVTVAFSLNYDGAPSPETRSYVRGSIYGVFPSDPYRREYSFLGWFDSATGGGRVYPSGVATAGVVLYAHWAKQEIYTIDYFV